MEFSTIIGEYRNGNYNVKIYSDGTKVRENNLDNLVPSFAENCDVCITKKCDGGCSWCYEGCTPDGKHADLMNAKFIQTLHPYTELAINGNDLSHPDLIPFLKKLKEKKIIANMTVMQQHFEEHYNFIKALIDTKLIYGIGVSLKNPTDDFIHLVQNIPNVVIHIINGIFTEDDYNKLKDNALKVLILGYKNLRRGVGYFESHSDEIEKNQRWLYDNLDEITNHFYVVSFDNLAINQLNVKRLLTDEQWDEFYMGDDSQYTFYIDMVEGVFAKNSISMERYPIMDNIDDMFAFVRRKAYEENNG